MAAQGSLIHKATGPMLDMHPLAIRNFPHGPLISSTRHGIQWLVLRDFLGSLSPARETSSHPKSFVMIQIEGIRNVLSRRDKLILK
jgi:hypothetical protein